MAKEPLSRTPGSAVLRVWRHARARVSQPTKKIVLSGIEGLGGSLYSKAAQVAGWGSA
jgi:hypothetical protein